MICMFESLSKVFGIRILIFISNIYKKNYRAWDERHDITSVDSWWSMIMQSLVTWKLSCTVVGGRACMHIQYLQQEMNMFNFIVQIKGASWFTHGFHFLFIFSFLIPQHVPSDFPFVFFWLIKMDQYDCEYPSFIIWKRHQSLFHFELVT